MKETPRASGGLYALKPWYTRQLGVFLRFAERRGMSPDTFTILGVLAAVLSIPAIMFGAWPLVFILLAARLAGANLDGALARARGVSRPWGFVLNELGDRASDLFMFAGLAALAIRAPSPLWSSGSWNALAWVLAAALAATLPTFASLSGAGVNLPRMNGGPFGKTERCLATVLTSAFPFLLPFFMFLVIIWSLATAALRLIRVHSQLASTGNSAP